MREWERERERERERVGERHLQCSQGGMFLHAYVLRLQVAVYLPSSAHTHTASGLSVWGTAGRGGGDGDCAYYVVLVHECESR